jgi:hypothetical protein
VGVLDASTSPPKEQYAVSKDNIIKLIQPGAYLSFWQKGIGISSDGTEVEVFRAYKDLNSRQPEWVAAELAVHDRFQS